jgi:hypothetical protein
LKCGLDFERIVASRTLYRGEVRKRRFELVLQLRSADQVGDLVAQASVALRQTDRGGAVRLDIGGCLDGLFESK